MKKIVIGWILVWAGVFSSELDNRKYVEKITKATVRLTRPIKVTTDTSQIEVEIFKIPGEYISASPVKIIIAGKGCAEQKVYFPIETVLYGKDSQGKENGKVLATLTQVINSDAVRIGEEKNLQIYGLNLKNGKATISFNQIVILTESDIKNSVEGSIEFNSKDCGVLVGVRSI